MNIVEPSRSDPPGPTFTSTSTSYKISPTTLTSPADPADFRTRLGPSAPAEYIRYLIVSALRRKGFDAAEAGALGDMERLVEHHIQRLFESAADHAALAGRQQPHAGDALASQDEALAAKRLKRESKQRRAALHCPVAPAGPSPPQHTTLDLLLDFASSAPEDMTTEIDRKPTAQDLLRHDAAGSQVFKKRTRQGAVPYYAFDWAPGLPASWMLLEQNEEKRPTPDKEPKEPPPRITSTSMDFVKSTTIVGENIPPELGIVHFLKTGGKRRRGNRVVAATV